MLSPIDIPADEMYRGVDTSVKWPLADWELRKRRVAHVAVLSVGKLGGFVWL